MVEEGWGGKCGKKVGGVDHGYSHTIDVHLNIRAGPTFAVLGWTVRPIYDY